MFWGTRVSEWVGLGLSWPYPQGYERATGFEPIALQLAESTPRRAWGSGFSGWGTRFTG